MDRNDGVRTRLTHSHEVSNLARSIGAKIATDCPTAFGVDFHEIVSPILQAISISHDLGNPPFGHQGETAISRWFLAREWIFHRQSASGENRVEKVPDEVRREFTNFDGNPQSIRLITRLQTHSDDLGLDLTAATVMASLKYPWSSSNYGNTEEHGETAKKYGYFASEKHVIDWARKETGIGEGQRHPLTWIMEACDDIAYSVLDADDAMKKGVISPDDVLNIIRRNDKIDKSIHESIESSFEKANKLDKNRSIINDIKISYLRAIFIDRLVDDASESYIKNIESIKDLSHKKSLMNKNHLCDTLKSIAKNYAFCHQDLLESEARGARAIDDLMTWLWDAITNRENPKDLFSRRTTPKDEFVFAAISPNYKDAAKNPPSSVSPTGNLLRYRELRLLTDMISGMTDTYALNLWSKLRDLS